MLYVCAMARGVKRTTIETKPCEVCGNLFERNRKHSDVQWRTTRTCSRVCRPVWNRGLTKHDDPRLMAIAESVRVSATGRQSWSKGLTKETHPTIAIISRKVSAAQIGKTINDAQRAGLASGQAWGRGRTKETCPIIARRAVHLSKLYKGRSNPEHSERMTAFYVRHPEKHPNAIVARKTKGRGFTFIEQIVADLLLETGVPFDYNKRIGSKWPDFSIPSRMLIIEADGEHWHTDAVKEAERDTYLESLGWRVLHLSGKALVNETAACRATILAALT